MRLDKRSGLEPTILSCGLLRLKWYNYIMSAYANRLDIWSGVGGSECRRYLLSSLIWVGQEELGSLRCVEVRG